MASHSGPGAADSSGATRVLALLDAVAAELRELAAHAGSERGAESERVASGAAQRAGEGLAEVRAWLSEATALGDRAGGPLGSAMEERGARSPQSPTSGATAEAPLGAAGRARVGPPPAPGDPTTPERAGPGLAPSAPAVVAVLRRGIDDLRELGEALEDEDPLAHFDAVQAVGLAMAVLEAAHQRLLRAGLAEPRPVDLLGA